ncbi:MAG: class I SAM-dependent methyltransferase [Candidatus Heimdallarchaeota archaeon]|nr:class I SAM-dependent methyltransferase [Candidatus Heimdallarchaeota archaeon]
MSKSEKFWDKRATEYNKDEKNWEETFNKALENTKKHLKENDIVMDYGCGSGILAIRLAKFVKEIHALDISSKMIESGKQRARGNKIENISFAQTTIFDEKYKRESFDVVLAFNILHLLEDSPKAVQRINELLKSGGLFISETASLGEAKSFLNFIISIIIKMRILPKVNKLKFADLENMIAQHGFQIIETEVLGEGISTYFVVAKKL